MKIRSIVIDGNRYLWSIKTGPYRLFDVSCCRQPLSGTLKVFRENRKVFEKQLEWQWGESITPKVVAEEIHHHLRLIQSGL